MKMSCIRRNLLLAVLSILSLAQGHDTLESTTATISADHPNTRNLSTTSRRSLSSPPWGKTSCVPKTLFYTPESVDECRDCCRTTKCTNRCTSQCNSWADTTASSRKSYCRNYSGPNRDGNPRWSTCENQLGYYKATSCRDYDDCVTDYWREKESEKIADDAWDWCMYELHPPDPKPECGEFVSCVYDEFSKSDSAKAFQQCEKDIWNFDPNDYVGGDCTGVGNCDGKRREERKLAECQFYSDEWKGGWCSCDGGKTWGKCTSCDAWACPDPPEPEPECDCKKFKECVYDRYYKAPAPSDAVDAKLDAGVECKAGIWPPSGIANNKCDAKLSVVPDWDPQCPRDSDFWEACWQDDCSRHLSDIQGAKSGSGSKSRKKICNKFWYCIRDYERDNSDSWTNEYASEKGWDARRDCNGCSDDGSCKSKIGNDHANGNCKEHLGGWRETCNDYHDCWSRDLRGECSTCANTGFGSNCDERFNNCYDSCMATLSRQTCQEECDVCFCESDPFLAIDRCSEIGNKCCEEPYDWLDDDDMRSLEYIRECSPSSTCGTCRGNCQQDSDCHNVNLCSKSRGIPNSQIPGCKGHPDKVTSVPRNRLNPSEVGYCYNPNKNYPSRESVTNQCLAQTTVAGYGKCCGLPRTASECGTVFGNYCDVELANPTDPLVRPGSPGGPIIEEPNRAPFEGSFCGINSSAICKACPTEDEDCYAPGKGCPSGLGCFRVSIPCPGTDCSSTSALQRSDPGGP